MPERAGHAPLIRQSFDRAGACVSLVSPLDTGMNFQTFRTWSWFLHFGSVHSQAARGVCWSPSMLTHATLPCRSRLGLSRPTSCAQVQQQQHAAAATRCMQPSRRVAAACSPLEQEGPAEPQQQQQPQQPQEQQQAETIASAMHRSLSGARALRTLCAHACACQALEPWSAQQQLPSHACQP